MQTYDDNELYITRAQRYEDFVRWLAQTQLELSMEKAYLQRNDFVKRARKLLEETSSS